MRLSVAQQLRPGENSRLIQVVGASRKTRACLQDAPNLGS